MPKSRTELIVALDVNKESDAKKLVDELYPEVKLFKVGSTLFTACGYSTIEYIYKIGGRVFLDLKWHDIPNTVYQTVSSGTASAITITTSINNDSRNYVETMDLGVFMMTVHTMGRKPMLEQAARGAKEKAEELNMPKPFIVGVTVLTSENIENVEEEVLRRAGDAQAAGLDGVVCSANEAATVREACGQDFIIVTPGIRPIGYKSDDQKRKATAAEAVKAGVNFIVVGRPIIEEDNKKEAAKRFLKELQIAN